MRLALIIISITCAKNVFFAQVTYFNKVYPNAGALNGQYANIEVDTINDRFEIIGVNYGEGSFGLCNKRLNFLGDFVDENIQEFNDTSLFIGVPESFEKIENGYLASYSYFFGALAEFYTPDMQRQWRYQHDNTDTSFVFYTQNYALSDGNLLFAGASILQYDEIIGDDDGPVLLSKLSNQGQPIWETFIHLEKEFGRIYSIHELSNGDIILTGTQAFDYDAVVLRLDSLGNLIWQHTFQSPPEDEYDDLWAQSVLLNDSTVMMSYGCGFGDEYPPQPEEGSSVRNLHLVKFNVNNQQIIWENEFPEIYGVWHYPNDILQTPDNSFAIVGNLRHSPLFWPIDSLFYSYSFSYIAKLDEAGDLLWNRRYKYSQDTTSYSSDQNLLFDIENTPDGGFVACGYVTDFDVNPEISAWVIKVDEFGCLEPGCQNVAVDEIRLDMQGAMTVYPNPVRSNCTIRLDLSHSKLHSITASTTLIVTDPNGRQIQNMTIPPMGLQYQLDINMSGMASGLYQAHWLDRKALLDSVQIVKE